MALNLNDILSGNDGETPDIDEEKVKVEDTRPRFQTIMMDTIDEMDSYSWRRGEMGGLDWGWDQLNKALEGLNTGVHLFAGQSNVGKSAIMMQLAQQVARANRVIDERHPRKAYVLYFSLDDTANELLPRFISIDQRIPINAVRFPKKFQHDQHIMERRAEGIKNLKEMTLNFGLMDANQGTDIEFIEETAKRYAFELAKLDEQYQIVLFIDNFHDITLKDVRGGGNDNNSKYDFIAGELSRIATQLDAPIVCTAEFRKLNGNRRPQLDDIRETVKIIYEAKAIILCYNEVGLRGQQATIYFNKPDSDEKQPIFEARVAKNKFSSFKGRLFYEFFPEMSFFKEVPEVGIMRYNSMISG
jgi:replicative DNA helicase